MARFLHINRDYTVRWKKRAETFYREGWDGLVPEAHAEELLAAGAAVEIAKPEKADAGAGS